MCLLSSHLHKPPHPQITDDLVDTHNRNFLWCSHRCLRDTVQDSVHTRQYLLNKTAGLNEFLLDIQCNTINCVTAMSVNYSMLLTHAVLHHHKAALITWQAVTLKTAWRVHTRPVSTQVRGDLTLLNIYSHTKQKTHTLANIAAVKMLNLVFLKV